MQFVVARKQATCVIFPDNKNFMVAGFNCGSVGIFDCIKVKTVGMIKPLGDIAIISIIWMQDCLVVANNNGELSMLRVNKWSEPAEVDIHALGNVGNEPTCLESSQLDPYYKFLVGNSQGRISV